MHDKNQKGQRRDGDPSTLFLCLLHKTKGSTLVRFQGPRGLFSGPGQLHRSSTHWPGGSEVGKVEEAVHIHGLAGDILTPVCR